MVRHLLIFLFTLALLAFPVQVVHAATIAVGGACTLADAIRAANTDSGVGGCTAGSGADTITLTGNVSLTGALPDVNSNMTIQGNGFAIARTGGPAFRLFRLASGALVINQTTLQGGLSAGNADSPVDASAILVSGGSLLLTNSTVTGNAVTDWSFTEGGAAIANDFGGSITIVDSTIVNNSINSSRNSLGGGGVAGGSITLVRSIVSGNTSNAGFTQVAAFGGVTVNNHNIFGSNGSSGTNFAPGATDIVPSGDASTIYGPLTGNVHPLVVNSPAIDAGGVTPCVDGVDQRNIVRPQGTNWDIGSYEVEQGSGRGGCAPPAPECSLAYAEPSLLWPPNHQMEAIAIKGITDPGGQPLTLVANSVFQDEPTNGSGDGNMAPDATLAPLTVRSERSGNRDGRVYHITVTASNQAGGSCTTEVRVGVPHSKNKLPVDGGALYDSTQ